MSFRPTGALFSHKLPPSTRAWLSRQYRDPYVKARLSFPNNYRSRSAFKLLELDKDYHFLTTGHVRTVIDLGAAPGGWSQVVAGKFGWAGWDSCAPNLPATPTGKDAKGQSEGEDGEQLAWSSGRKTKTVKKTKASAETGEVADDYPDLADLDAEDVSRPVGRGTTIAVDLLRMEPIPGVKTVQMDFLSSKADEIINSLLIEAGGDGKADVVLSDMAANFTGNPTADAHASLQLSESVFEFVKRHLRTAASVGKRRAGVLVLKHFTHPSANKFRKERLNPNFNIVKYVKPPASRAESSEAYWVCMGWKGVQPPEQPVETADATS